MSDDLHNEIARLDRENDALRAAVRRVEAELARREKCAADERAAGRVCDYCEDFIPEVRAALGEPPADTWIPCCEHCGCTVDRSGHDDTCSYGCNDAPSAGGSTPDPADIPHYFHMSSYVGSEPRCWCDKFASDPIHVAAGGSSTPATPPADHIAIFDGPPQELHGSTRSARETNAPVGTSQGAPTLCVPCRSDEPDAHGGCCCGHLDNAAADYSGEDDRD